DGDKSAQLRFHLTSTWQNWDRGAWYGRYLGTLSTTVTRFRHVVLAAPRAPPEAKPACRRRASAPAAVTARGRIKRRWRWRRSGCSTLGRIAGFTRGGSKHRRTGTLPSGWGRARGRRTR